MKLCLPSNSENPTMIRFYGEENAKPLNHSGIPVFQVRYCEFRMRYCKLPSENTCLYQNLYSTVFADSLTHTEYSMLSQAQKELRGHISCDDTKPSLLVNVSKWRREAFCEDISREFFSVYVMDVDSLFGKFLLSPEMSKINVLCS